MESWLPDTTIQRQHGDVAFLHDKQVKLQKDLSKWDTAGLNQASGAQGGYTTMGVVAGGGRGQRQAGQARPLLVHGIFLQVCRANRYTKKSCKFHYPAMIRLCK